MENIEKIREELAMMRTEYNLWQKLNEVRKHVKTYNKETNPGVKYKSVRTGQIFNMIRDIMDELELILVPNIVGGIEMFTYQQQTKNGPRDKFVVHGAMKYEWINGTRPEERQVCDWHFVGDQDDYTKTFGGGLTYAERYFLMKFFQAPTDEDDPDRSSGSGYSSSSKPTKVTDVQVKALEDIITAKGYNKNEVLNYARQLLNNPNATFADLDNATYPHVLKAVGGQ